MYVFRSKGPDGKPRGRWRFQFTDWQGRRRTGSGSLSRRETEQLAAHVQADQDAIRRGWKPAPKRADKPHGLADVVAEYCAWGRSQGGRGGRPWSAEHVKKRETRLAFWIEQLHVSTVQEIRLSKVEAILRELQTKGRKPKRGEARPMSGRTLAGYSEAIRALCKWAKLRGYLAEDPLEGMASFDVTPRTRRRALTPAEVLAVLEHAETPVDRLLFRVALCTGYRAGELRALRVRDLDVKGCTLPLDAQHTKNRAAARQPIPPALALELQESVRGKPADAPLLDLLENKNAPSQRLYRAMERAGIPKWAPGGKMDFHALRVTFTSLILEAGASAKEAQALARHSTPALTMNTYGRARFDRLRDVAQVVGDLVMGAAGNTAEAQRKAAGAESLTLADGYMAERGGFEASGANPRPGTTGETPNSLETHPDSARGVASKGGARSMQTRGGRNEARDISGNTTSAQSNRGGG